MSCCCNEPAIALTGSLPNASQHVNYSRGMVLGVDDYQQEFAYLNGRPQWLAREVLGYGTLSGLHVYAENVGNDEVRLHLKAGTALAQSGQLISVTDDQCCGLNFWLTRPESASAVNRLVGGGSPPTSPPALPQATSALISLYLTLAYASCATAPAPIQGEPCRSDDNLMANSRIADDYRLELRTEPPAHVEESALRDFVAWLRTGVEVSDTGTPPGDETIWRDVLRAAVRPWISSFEASPPVSPPPTVASLGDYLSDVSPPALTIGRSELCAFLRVALRVWATEMRPWWMSRACGRAAGTDDDCLLLARVEFPIIWVGQSPGGAWRVDGDEKDVKLDERDRPVLAHLRLLQEWLLCGCDCGAGSGPARAVAMTAHPQPRGFSRSADVGSVHVALAFVNEDLTLDASHHVVLCDKAPDITLPKCGRENRGRVYIVKNAGPVLKLACAPGDLVDGVATKSIRKGSSMAVVSDGKSGWHIIAAVA